MLTGLYIYIFEIYVLLIVVWKKRSSIRCRWQFPYGYVRTQTDGGPKGLGVCYVPNLGPSITSLV
ncbi:hypothetical protein HanIR_Chr15g0774461 [Helianthus annuus]|nr:hypothetical protein HanIR_Chr15g0774461 [Helianthus annuus]